MNRKMALALRGILFPKHDIRVWHVTKTIQFDLVRRCSDDKNVANIEKNSYFEYRQLELYPRPRDKRRRREQSAPIKVKTPRTKKMRPEMDWTNIWPGPKTFHPASVPLPLYQGVNKNGPPPGKYANTELMKIPNFLHLTPPAIEKHCKAIKQFCTEWPSALKTDEDIEKHFPVEIISSDYCHASCSIREPKSREITLRIKLKNLKLDEHSRDKLLRIVAHRHSKSTDYVTIKTCNCPIKKQNYEYAHYLLTAVYFEAWKYEEWEKLKSDDDMEKYVFKQRKSLQNVKTVFEYNKKEVPNLEEFEKVVEEWQNKGDNPTVINNYKEAAMKLLSMPAL